MRDHRHDEFHTPSTRATRPRRLTRRQRMASIASGLYEPHDLLPIHVTKSDYRHLRSLLRATRSEAPVLSVLARKLDRALDIPSDAITLGTRAVFRANIDQRLQACALVSEAVPPAAIGGAVSVLTPLGVALLDVRAGNRTSYFGPDGRLRTASVESIVSQPESQERELRRRYHPSPYADPAPRKSSAATLPDRVGSPDSSHPSGGSTRDSVARTLPVSTDVEPQAILPS
jgi:regulator of nucleoside diphosphate kinase